MPGILNQDEISAMMRATGSEAEEPESPNEQESRKYGFKYPDPLSKEQIRYLEHVHSDLAANGASSFSTPSAGELPSCREGKTCWNTS